MARVALTVFLVVGVSGAPVAQGVTLDRVAWLQGCWRSVNGQTTIEEHWMAPRGGTMLGMGRTVRGERTTEYELVMIAVKDGRLAYEAHPSGQRAATFIAGTMSDTEVVFENPQHDFPQRVAYRREGGNRLLAWIEGSSNGKTRRIEFPYQRARCDAS